MEAPHAHGRLEWVVRAGFTVPFNAHVPQLLRSTREPPRAGRRDGRWMGSRARQVIRAALLLAALLVAVCVVAAACRSWLRAHSATAASQPLAPGFVGSQVCAGCHGGVAAAHAR